MKLPASARLMSFRRHRACAAVVGSMFAGCARLPAAAEQPANVPFELAAGASVRIAGTATSLSVVSIADSRCPSDVTCVAAGDAVVVVARPGVEGVRIDTLRLRGTPHSVSGERGELLELVDVRPYPRSTEVGRVSVAVLRVR